MAVFTVDKSLVEAAPIAFSEVRENELYLHVREDSTLLIGVPTAFQTSTPYSSACWWGTFKIVMDVSTGVLHRNDNTRQRPSIFLSKDESRGMIYKISSVDGVVF